MRLLKTQIPVLLSVILVLLTASVKLLNIKLIVNAIKVSLLMKKVSVKVNTPTKDDHFVRNVEIVVVKLLNNVAFQILMNVRIRLVVSKPTALTLQELTTVAALPIITKTLLMAMLTVSRPKDEFQDA